MNNYFSRKYAVQGIFITVALIIVARLFYLQLIDDTFLLSANNNVFRKTIIYPARGVILDRHGEVLVQNEPVYDLLVTPREVGELDTNLFCQLIDIDREGFEKRMEAASKHSRYRASIFEKQISARNYAQLQEQLYKFKGFYVQNRTVRNYPDSIAAQFLGYIQEVNPADIERSNKFYRPGDYIGASGVERAYEEVLRGQRGVKIQMVDAFNRPQGSYAEGRFDTLAVAGESLVSSLDKDLQILAEQLMKNKRGSVVAIEPSTGEILTFVSSPTYDPNEMVGRKRGENYGRLANDPNNPMFIRPIQAQYPPGSIFKVVNALTALQAGVIDVNTVINCGGGYSYGGGRGFMRCTSADGPTSLIRSIQRSCNTYYGHTFARMLDRRGMPAHEAYDLWREATMKFGLGQPLGIDLPGEKAGTLPTSEYYTERYGNDRWTSSFNISLSIGQGEIENTPIQMANLMAIVANRGFYYRPHLIKGIGAEKIIKPEYTEQIHAGVDAQYYDPVIEGLSQAVNQPGGTGYRFKITDIEMCGKTGTVQNPHGDHHAVFFAFAPRDNPKIAIAVFVENAGYGGAIAGPIASMLVEKYLKDTITLPQYLQDRIYQSDFMPKPVEPRNIQSSQQSASVSALDATLGADHMAVMNPRWIAEQRRDEEEEGFLVHHSELQNRHGYQ